MTCDPPITPDPKPLAIDPPTEAIATCRTAQFTATPADNVSWMVTGGGTIDATGLYHAPIQVPDPAMATITASRAPETASASVTLATAFPTDFANRAGSGRRDVTRPHAGSSRSIAAVSSDEAGGRFAGFVTSDDGMQWGGVEEIGVFGIKAPLTTLAVTPDAGDPNIVYALLRAEAGGPLYDTLDDLGDEEAGSMLVLSRTNVTTHDTQLKTLYSGGNGDVDNADLVSPSAGTIFVIAPTPYYDDSTLPAKAGTEMLTWRGTFAAISPLAPGNNGYGARWADADHNFFPPNTYVDTNAHGKGIVLATDGANHVCETFLQVNGTANGVLGRCTADGGTTWVTSPVFTPGANGRNARPRISVGGNGMIVTIAFTQYVSAVDEIGRTTIVVSSDGGDTFTVHDYGQFLDGSNQALPLHWLDTLVDHEGVIWLARAIDDERIQFDKSCDLGVTWSGALMLEEADVSVTDPFLVETNHGVFVDAVRTTNDSTFYTPISVRLLEP